MDSQYKNPLSLQPNLSLFEPATSDEKQSLVIMRESVGFWRDGFRRLRKNNIAMISFIIIVIILIFAFIVPSFYP